MPDSLHAGKYEFCKQTRALHQIITLAYVSYKFALLNCSKECDTSEHIFEAPVLCSYMLKSSSHFLGPLNSLRGPSVSRCTDFNFVLTF